MYAVPYSRVQVSQYTTKVPVYNNPGSQCTVYCQGATSAPYTTKVPLGHQQRTRAFLKIWRAEHSINKVYHLKFVQPPQRTRQTRPFKKKAQVERGRQGEETNRRIRGVILEDITQRPDFIYWEECELNSAHISLSSDGSNRGDFSELADKLIARSAYLLRTTMCVRNFFLTFLMA